MMRRPTDFLLTCSCLVCDLRSAMRHIHKQAFTHAALGVAMALVAIVIVPSVVVAFVLPPSAVAWAWWWVRRTDRRALVPQVVETYREYGAARARYAPASTVSGELPKACLLKLWGIAAVPVVPVAGWWLARRLLRGCTTRSLSNGLAAVPSAITRAEQALELFLGYPDTTLATPSGCGGVWFPSQALRERRAIACSLVLPVHVAACAGAVSGLVLAGTLAHVHSVAASIGALVLVGGSVSCLAVVGLAREFLVSCLAAPVARVAAQQRALLPAVATEWEDLTQRVANSTYEEGGVFLCDHLYMGQLLPAHTEPAHPYRHAGPEDTPSAMPLLLHRSVWQGNCHATGPTRTGKSVLFVLGFAMQLIRSRVTPELDATGQPRVGVDGEVRFTTAPPMPMLLIELKGDLAVVNTVVEECRRAGRTCRLFTLEEGCATAYFSPIKNLNASNRHIVEFVEIVLDILSLFHGLAYGESYFSKQNRDLLLRTMKAARRKPESWEELHRLLLDSLDHSQHRDVFELLSSIYAIAQFPALSPPPPGAEEIDFARAIRDGEVVVFSLRARVGAMTVRDVARMALYCFLIAAGEHNARVGPRPSVCFIDEAQVVCQTENIAVVFQQCSGANMTLVLSNQSSKDLNTDGTPHLADIVRTNTHYKQAFGIFDPEEAGYWVDMSGEDIAYLIGTTESHTTTTSSEGGSSTSRTRGVTRQPVVHKRLTQDVINQVNNSLGLSLALAGSSGGFTQLKGIPRRLWTPWLMSKAEYERRKHTPWPAAAAPAAAAASGVSPTRMVNTKSPERVEAEARDKYAALEALFRSAAQRAGGAPTRPKEGRHVS